MSRNISKYGLAALPLFLVSPWVRGSSGTEGASFLDIPIGAEPAALGGAYTALATNAYAPTWNPAGLARLSNNEAAAQHLSYLESINYEHLSFVHPLSNGSSPYRRGVGFSVQYLGSGDINRTDLIAGSDQPQNDGNPTGTFSSHYASYNLSYGQTINEKLAVGLTGKIINAKIDDVNTNAYATDLGALYKAQEHLQVGMSVVNIGSRLKLLNEGNNLPLAFKISGAYQPESRYLAATEMGFARNGIASFHLGGQWRPVETLSLRAGFRTDALHNLGVLAGFSVGLGLHLWGQEFAYAWLPYGDLGDAQYFSLLIHFGATTESRKNLIQYQNIKEHRTVKRRTTDQDEMDPEYQQMMKLLSADDKHTAQTPATLRKQRGLIR